MDEALEQQALQVLNMDEALEQQALYPLEQRALYVLNKDEARPTFAEIAAHGPLEQYALQVMSELKLENDEFFSFLSEKADDEFDDATSKDKRVIVWLNRFRFRQCDKCQHWFARTSKRWCAGCRKVVYCGPTCQKAHWKDHKPNCTSMPTQIMQE